jgi:hypothetical protein
MKGSVIDVDIEEALKRMPLDVREEESDGTPMGHDQNPRLPGPNDVHPT